MRPLFLFLLLILSGTNIMNACECLSSSHEKTFREAKGIFVGQLIEIGSKEIEKSGFTRRLLKFEVERKWKGIQGNEITLLTNHSNMCSAFQFQPGESYLLYVYKDSYVTSDCASSIELKSAYAQERIEDLDSFWFRMKARLWVF